MKKNSIKSTSYSSNLEQLKLSDEELRIEKEFNRKLLEILG